MNPRATRLLCDGDGNAFVFVSAQVFDQLAIDIKQRQRDDAAAEIERFNLVNPAGRPVVSLVTKVPSPLHFGREIATDVV